MKTTETTLDCLIQLALDNHIVDQYQDLPYVSQTDHCTINNPDALLLWLIATLN